MTAVADTAPAAPLLPDPTDAVAAPFWSALHEHRLTAQRCTSCGLVRLPPSSGCPDCLGTDAEWIELAGTGTVWSYAVYHRALHAAFAGQVPYTIAVVDLDGGPRVAARVAGPPLPVGSRVRTQFEDITPEVTLIRWRAVD